VWVAWRFLWWLSSHLLRVQPYSSAHRWDSTDSSLQYSRTHRISLTRGDCTDCPATRHSGDNTEICSLSDRGRYLWFAGRFVARQVWSFHRLTHDCLVGGVALHSRTDKMLECCVSITVGKGHRVSFQESATPFAIAGIATHQIQPRWHTCPCYGSNQVL